MKASLKIEPFGELIFNKRENEWFGYMNNIFPTHQVECGIEVESKRSELEEKIQFFRYFVEHIEVTNLRLFEFIHQRYENSGKTVDELKCMYFLRALTLKDDGKTWRIVFEPNFDVESIYNHFIRFTYVDKKITWSNLS